MEVCGTSHRQGKRLLLVVGVCVLAGAIFAPVAAAGWDPPSFLPPAGTNADNALIETSNDGARTRRVWRAPDGTNTRVAAGSNCPGPCWVSPAGQTAFEPALAVGNTRDAVAWSASDGTNSRIGLWIEGCGAATNVSGAGKDAFQPGLAVNDAGDIAVVWRRYNSSGNSLIQLARVPSGSCVAGSPVNLSGSGQNASFARVALDSAATAVTVWLRFDGAHDRVQQRQQTGGGALGAILTLSSSGGDAFDARVAMAADGSSYALWTRSNGTHSFVQGRSRSPSDLIGPLQTLSAGGQDAISPELAMTPGGDALAIWSRSDGSNPRIQARARSAAGTLGGTQTVSPAGVNTGNPDVGVDDNGNAMLAWTEFGGGNVIQTRTRSAAGFLGNQKTLSATGADNVDVAVGPSGNARAVWIRFNGANFRAETAFYHNNAPTDITLTNAAIEENKPAGALVGDMATVDPESDQGHAYTLVPGTGSSGNSAFTIVGTHLKAAAPLDFETQSSYSIRVRTTDDGLPQRFKEKIFTITVTDVNDPPVAGADSYSGAVGNTKAALGVSVSPPVVTLSGNVLLANDTDQDAGTTLTAVPQTVSTAEGGTAKINADGSFVYVPGVGDKNLTDSFTYKITDGIATRNGTASIGIVDALVWYLNSALPTNGDGRSSDPFNTITAVNALFGVGDPDRPGDILFLYPGSYPGGLPLEPGQSLFGRTHGLTVGATVILNPSGTTPTLFDGLSLASDNNVQGLNIGDSVGYSLSGTSIGTTSIDNLTPGMLSNSTGGGAVYVDGGGSLTASFSSVSGAGLSLIGLAGSFTAPAGALSGAAGAELDLNGGTINVTYGGTVANSSGLAVDIKNRTGGGVTLTGPISSSGAGGISLSSNTGSAVTFGGPLNLSTGPAPAFSAVGGGTLVVTDSTNTLSTTTGTALDVQSTTIGGPGLIFRSIQVAGSAGSPTYGIRLQDTGASGGLTVTGNSAGLCGGEVATSTAPNESDCTGGTIQGTDSAAVFLNDTKGVSLTRVNLANNFGSGIEGASVNGLAVTSSLIQANGNSTGGTEAGIRLVNPQNLVLVKNSTVMGSYEDNVWVSKSSGPTTLSLSGTTVGPNSVVAGNNGLTLLGTGTGSVALSVAGSNFTGNQSAAILTSFTDSSAQNVDISGTRFSNNNAAVALGSALNADMTFDVHGNGPILGSKADAIQILAGATSTTGSSLSGKIRDNTIGGATADSGSRDLMGIAVEVNDDADAVVSITGNTIVHTDQDGIFAQSRDFDGNATAAKLDLTIRDNSVQSIDDNGAFPFGFVAGTRVEARHDTSLCLDIAGNTSAEIGGAGKFRVRQRDTSVFQLERYAGAPADDAAVSAFIAAQNDPGSTATATHATGYTGVADGSCRTP